MTSIAALINKLWAGEATADELSLLQEMLSDENCSFKDELLQAYEHSLKFKNNYFLLTRKREREILMALNKEIKLEKSGNGKVVFFRKAIVWAAACVLLFVAGTVFWLKLNTNDSKAFNDVPVAVAGNKQEPRIISNHSDTTQSIVLMDSSLVALSPGSELTVSPDFNVAKRNIELTGKATFKVAKDINKPFAVLAKGFITTALGTQFTINTLSKDIVDVKLIEGKVVVTRAGAKVSAKEIFLLPNEEFVCNTLTGLTTVKRFENDRAPVEKIKDFVASGELAFDNESLEKVFEKLQTAFDTKIQFNRNEFATMTLTGTFRKKDGLQKVLTVICNMNDLVIGDSSGTIIISKKN